MQVISPKDFKLGSTKTEELREFGAFVALVSEVE